MTILQQPFQMIGLLFALSLLPLFAVMGTSFLKISIVLSMLRNALGIQQIPPNIAIYGLSLILTLFIMAPIGMEIGDNLKAQPLDTASPNLYEQIDKEMLTPYRRFLDKNTSPEQVRFFSNIGKDIWPERYKERLSEDSIAVAIPAFAVSQLTEAFKISLLIYLPFIAIDIIVSNVLLAMGMMMVSPMTISLPLKILIFVLINGWEKLIGQLLLSYQ